MLGPEGAEAVEAEAEDDAVVVAGADVEGVILQGDRTAIVSVAHGEYELISGEWPVAAVLSKSKKSDAPPYDPRSRLPIMIEGLHCEPRRVPASLPLASAYCASDGIKRNRPGVVKGLKDFQQPRIVSHGSRDRAKPVALHTDVHPRIDEDRPARAVSGIDIQR